MPYHAWAYGWKCVHAVYLLEEKITFNRAQEFGLSLVKYLYVLNLPNPKQ